MDVPPNASVFLRAEQFPVYCTTKLELIGSAGISSVATGFFVAIHRPEDSEGRGQLLLITNWHAVQGTTKGRCKLTKMRFENGKAVPVVSDTLQVDLPGDASAWVQHPSADLCAINVTPVTYHLARAGQYVCIAPFQEDQFASDAQIQRLSPTCPVVMVGYPKGIHDEVNNQPVFRRGVAATWPKVNYLNRPQFLVDIACFPGSSGSPILLWDDSYSEGDTLHFGSRFALLGVLYSGWSVDIDGNTELTPIPTGLRKLNVMPMHLGCAMRVDEVRELIEEVRRRIPVT